MSQIFSCNWPDCDFEGSNVEIIEHITSKFLHLGIISTKQQNAEIIQYLQYPLNVKEGQNNVYGVPRTYNGHSTELHQMFIAQKNENKKLNEYIKNLEENLRNKEKQLRKLKQKKQKEHTLVKFMCLLCELPYLTKERLKKHIIEEHSPKETCPYPGCTASFPRQKMHRMHNHIHRHHLVLKQEDAICKKSDNKKLNAGKVDEEIDISMKHLDIPYLEDISDASCSDESETDFDEIEDPQIDLE